MGSSQKIQNILSSLSRQEQADLLAALISGNSLARPCRAFQPGELSLVEKKLAKDIDQAQSPKVLNSRVRLWFIFMLLRYGGMRLEEIFSLEPENLNLSASMINITKGKNPRELPLPPLAVRQMRSRLESWPALAGLPRPFFCDSSLVRRGFAQCAARCEVSSGLLTARALRRHRALELERAGLPQPLINLYLGRYVAEANFNVAQGAEILKQAILNEQFPRTSARNAFNGRLVRLEKKGVLVKTWLETASGLLVEAIITDTSRQNLELKTGSAATALVKAPWVEVHEAGASGPNHFYGKIKEIKEDNEAMEISVLLPQGNIVCSLYTQGRKPDFSLYPDMPIGARFSPLSVILTVS